MIEIGPFVSGETPAPLLYVFQDDNGDPLDLDGYTATFQLHRYGSTATSTTADITDVGTVSHTWDPADLATAGVYECSFTVDSGANRYVSDRIVFRVAAAVAA